MTLHLSEEIDQSRAKKPCTGLERCLKGQKFHLIVHDRIRSFLQKHIFTVMEITDRDAAMMAEVELDDPDLPRLKHQIIVARLDGRKWKPKPKPKAKDPAPVKKRGRKPKAAPTEPAANAVLGKKAPTAKKVVPAKKAAAKKKRPARAANA